MNVRPLVIGEAERQRVEEVLSFAREHLYRPGPGAPVPGDDPRHEALFLLGFRCVFSFTEFPGEGIFRHLSVSVSGEDLPSGPAVELLGQLFGFTDTLSSWILAIHGDPRCVVVAQPIDPAERLPGTPP